MLPFQGRFSGVSVEKSKEWSRLTSPLLPPGTVPPRVAADGPAGAEAEQRREEGGQEGLRRGEEGVGAVHPALLRPLLPSQRPEPDQHPSLQPEELVSVQQLTHSSASSSCAPAAITNERIPPLRRPPARTEEKPVASVRPVQSTPVPMMPQKASTGSGQSDGPSGPSLGGFPVNCLQKAGVFVQRIITSTGKIITMFTTSSLNSLCATTSNECPAVLQT